jgi:hypothetical protein
VFYVSTEYGNQQIVEYDIACPHCLKPMPHADQTIIAAHMVEEGVKFELVYRCPRSVCDKMHIAIFNWVDKVGYEFSHTTPAINTRVEFDREIQDISSEFSNIYNQAVVSEQLGLNHICGMGYRKSLEFLIKDYASFKNPSDAEKIRDHKTQLGQVIQLYIQHEAIKETAKRAAWLGNDETHYTRKWIDKDINDLKALINLTVQWIKLDLMTLRYTSEMR